MIREATPEDFKSYEFHPDWNVEEPFGYVVMSDDMPVGLGLASRDREGRFWLWSRFDEPVPAIALHRRALELLRAIRERGGERAYAFPDPKQPGAPAWLNRLGFRPDRMTVHPSGELRMAWACDLSN